MSATESCPSGSTFCSASVVRPTSAWCPPGGENGADKHCDGHCSRQHRDARRSAAGVSHCAGRRARLLLRERGGHDAHCLSELVLHHSGRDAHHAIAELCEVTVAPRVSAPPGRRSVTPAVDFNDEFYRRGQEVSDVPANRNLAPEAHPQLGAGECLPQDGFREGWCSAMSSSMLGNGTTMGREDERATHWGLERPAVGAGLRPSWRRRRDARPGPCDAYFRAILDRPIDPAPGAWRGACAAGRKPGTHCRARRPGGRVRRPLATIASCSRRAPPLKLATMATRSGSETRGRLRTCLPSTASLPRQTLTVSESIEPRYQHAEPVAATSPACRNAMVGATCFPHMGAVFFCAALGAKKASTR